jgi:hypothetical protein
MVVVVVNSQHCTPPTLIELQGLCHFVPCMNHVVNPKIHLVHPMCELNKVIAPKGKKKKRTQKNKRRGKKIKSSFQRRTRIRVMLLFGKI